MRTLWRYLKVSLVREIYIYIYIYTHTHTHTHIHVHDLFDRRHHNGNSDSDEAQKTQGDDALEISHVPAKTRTGDAAPEDAAVVVEGGHASLTA